MPERLEPATRRRLSTMRRGAGALVASALVVGLAQLPTTSVAAEEAAPPNPDALRTLGDSPAGLSNLDLRGTALPTSLQKKAARSLDATVRWNDFGTPASIFSTAGKLGKTSSADPVVAARTWLAQHRDVFGLSAAQVAGLELVNNQKLAQSGARAVLFRQRFGDLTPALGSMVTVGVARGRIVYVSSSLTRTTGSPVAATLSPAEAWLTAAKNVGLDVTGSDILDTVVDKAAGGWTRFRVDGIVQDQMTRLRALAFADGSVRPVFETNVIDVQGGSAFAYTLMVDAATGKVLHRENQVENSSDAFPINGEITATDCGPKHAFELTDDKTKQIAVVASTVNPVNDIVIKLFAPDGELLSSGDLGTSPETLTYAPGGTLAKGIYHAQICPFDVPTVPFTAGGQYAGMVTTSDEGGPQASAPFPPKWAFFTANPSLSFSTTDVPKNRSVGCWVTKVDGNKVDGCDFPLANPAARAPWDYNFKTGLPTFTTIGNAANTHEAWVSPLTPGGLAQAPYSPTREYTPEFTDAWQNSKCDPANLVPGRQRHRRLRHAPVLGAQPDARLRLLPGLHRAELQPAAGQPRQQPGPDPRERLRGRQRPGRCDRRAAVGPRPRQRQPDRAAGRRPRHHQPVPLPAHRGGLLRPLHRRQLRHEHRRPRVHPRDQQPHDRRPRRGDHLRAGRRDGRVLG